MPAAAELFLHCLESEAAGDDPFAAEGAALVACLREGRAWQPPDSCLATPLDRHFAEAIALATMQHAAAMLVRRSRCGRELDLLGDPAWNALGWAEAEPRRRMLHCARAAARALRPAEAAAPPLLVTSIRNEAPRLLDWLAYHRSIGLSDILIYSNDNTDGSDSLLYALASRGYVTWVDNDCGGEVSPQIKAFEHALLFGAPSLAARRAAFIDADEYLVFAEPDAPAALAPMFAPEVGAVALHWRWFTHDGRYTTRPGLIAEQYTRARTDPHVKCVVDLSATFSMRKVHLPVFGPGDWRLLDADGRAYDEAEGVAGRALAGGQVNHYWSTSFLDYALKKDRGRGAVARSGEQRAFGQFFDWGSPRHCPDIDLRIRPRLAAQAAERQRLLADNAIRRAQREVDALYAENIARLSADDALRGLYFEGCTRSGVAPQLEVAPAA